MRDGSISRQNVRESGGFCSMRDEIWTYVQCVLRSRKSWTSRIRDLCFIKRCTGRRTVLFSNRPLTKGFWPPPYGKVLSAFFLPLAYFPQSRESIYKMDCIHRSNGFSSGKGRRLLFWIKGLGGEICTYSDWFKTILLSTVEVYDTK